MNRLILGDELRAGHNFLIEYEIWRIQHLKEENKQFHI
jgi:hypothetical protein